jgi:hypothetical protein
MYLKIVHTHSQIFLHPIKRFKASRVPFRMTKYKREGNVSILKSSVNLFIIGCNIKKSCTHAIYLCASNNAYKNVDYSAKKH